MSDAFELARVLILLGIANFAPILACRLLGERFGRALDGGRRLRDGQPLFGDSKTLRGLIASLGATALAAPLLGLPWWLGMALAAASMAGDLGSSFAKRRMGRPVHAQALGLDQVPEALLPLALLRAPLGLDWLDVALVVAAFVVLELLLSGPLFRLGIRDRPY